MSIRARCVSVLAFCVSGLAMTGCQNGKFECPFADWGKQHTAPIQPATASSGAVEKAGAPASPQVAVLSDVPAAQAKFLEQYKGTPFTDEKMPAVQKIPGIVYPAYYDKGGEGVAFHYGPKTNLGSNGLNKGGNKYEDKFRRDEAVSTSYTKDFADKWEGQKAFPAMGLLYLGWTEPGEWVNVTVDVAEAGTYSVDLMYTSNRGGEISLDVNGEKATGPLKIETTNDPADKTDWRQWHHWNLAKNLAEVKLLKGKNVLTLHVDKEGNMNLLTLEFKKK